MSSRTVSKCRRYRPGAVVGVELVHALVFLPLVVVGVLLLLALPLSVPLLAEAERALERLSGTDVPLSRRHGQDRRSWYTGRVTRAAFWRQDVPLVLGGTVLAGLSFLLSAVGLSAVAAFLLSPFTASPENPVVLTLGSWRLTVTSAEQAWWFLPIGLLLLVLTWFLLAGVGRVRGRMSVVLSRTGDEERIEALAEQVGHLATSRVTLVDAFEAERARIERDLHDGTQQDLVSLAMSLGVARLHVEKIPEDEVSGNARAGVLADLDTAHDRVEAALRSLRETVHGIRPAVLTERGLAPALRDLGGRAPLPTRVTVTGTDADLCAISSPVATAVYFAVAEALTNAAKHAGPHATARVVLAVTSVGLSCRPR